MPAQTPYDLFTSVFYKFRENSSIYQPEEIILNKSTSNFNIEGRVYDGNTGEETSFCIIPISLMLFNKGKESPLVVADTADLERVPLESSLGRIIQERKRVKS